MRNRGIALALISALVTAFLVILAPTANAATWRCSLRHDRVGHTFKEGHGQRADVYVQANVFYRYCVNTSPDFLPYVKPHHVIVSYQVDASKISCNDWGTGWLDDLDYNMYFWRPYNGVNFNPPQKTIPCSTEAFASRSQWYKLKNVPRLYFGPGHGPRHQPRWRIVTTLGVNLAPDKVWAHSQDFKP